MHPSYRLGAVVWKAFYVEQNKLQKIEARLWAYSQPTDGLKPIDGLKPTDVSYP